MIFADDTTLTNFDIDMEDDKTQYLSGEERLEYFDDNPHAIVRVRNRKISVVRRLTSLFK
jgi:hypothetical protein